MDDIIWITYKGRRIPIKPGMKGKFDKKKLNNKLSENDKVKLKKIGKLIKEDKETGNTANRMKAIEDQERYDRLYDRYKEEGINEEKIKDRLGERPKTGLEDEELNKRYNKEEKKFEPRAVGAKSFKEHGVAFGSYETNKRFSDYLRDKYGTDDIDIITTGSEKNAKTLRHEFNEKELESNREIKGEEWNKIQKEKQTTKMSKSEAEIDRKIKSGEIKIDYENTPRKYVEVIDEHFGNWYKAGTEDTFRKWTEEQNIKTEKPRVQYNTVSDYEQYFIGLGYSKATALKRAKEIIAERKKK